MLAETTQTTSSWPGAFIMVTMFISIAWIIVTGIKNNYWREKR